MEKAILNLNLFKPNTIMHSSLTIRVQTYHLFEFWKNENENC